MRIDYKEFQAQMASELSALGTPSKEEKSSSRVIALELSEFSALPAGAKVRLEAVNVTKLQPGDYVLIAQPGCRPLENDVLRAQFLQLLARARSLKASAPPGTMPASPVGVERPAPES